MPWKRNVIFAVQHTVIVHANRFQYRYCNFDPPAKDTPLWYLPRDKLWHTCDTIWISFCFSIAKISQSCSLQNPSDQILLPYVYHIIDNVYATNAVLKWLNAVGVFPRTIPGYFMSYRLWCTIHLILNLSLCIPREHQHSNMPVHTAAMVEVML